MRERTVARAILCKQTGVNFRGLLPVQRAHAESYCFFYAKLEPTLTLVVYGPKRRRKAAVKAAASGCYRYAASLSDHLPMLKDGENLVEEPRERHTKAASYI